MAPRTVPQSNATVVYFSGPHKLAGSLIRRQGLEQISFDGERKLVNADWAKRCASILLY